MGIELNGGGVATSENRAAGRLLGGMLFAGVALIALSAPAAAQVAAPTTPPAVDDEEIVVTGLRSSLANALAVRRNADVILDGISSDDIGSTPDLNLGEALQRIPGVQIDRSEERRNATISVRGLPGAFARTTLMGQNVATPTRGTGNGSPFGIFDASIFNGANVVKSFTADIPAGGLSANVDLRLTPALSRREGFVVRAEMQYEESNKDFNPALFGSFSQKFGDRFGIYGNIAYSKQSYRRDEISINSYGTFSATRAAQYGVAQRAADGTPQVLLFPSQVRLQSREESGDRLSASAGMEYELTNALNLRVDGIYTRRKLDQSRLDLLRLQYADINNARAGDTGGQIIVATNPDGSPKIVKAGTGAFGANANANVFVAPEITTRNPQYFPDNRIFSGNDQSWAVYPQLVYEDDDWNARLIGTYSRATGADVEVLVGARVDSKLNPTAAAATANPNTPQLLQSQLTNGITLNVNTGAGNYRDFGFNTTLPSPLYDLAGRTFTVGAIATTNPDGNRAINVLSLTGSSPSVERTLRSVAGEIERKFNFGPFTAVRVGARYDDEKGDIEQVLNTILGAQLGNLSNDILDEHLGFSTGGTYFGGQVPGALVDPIVYGVDIDKFLTAVTTPNLAPPGSAGSAQPTSGIVPADVVLNPKTGLYSLPARLAGGQDLLRLQTRNFEARRKNVEAFGMVRFDLSDWEASGLPIRGNLGMRYVDARLNGRTTVSNPAVPKDPTSGRYRAWLPSANFIANISRTVDLRAAYYQTFEAFDVAEFTPTADYVTIQAATPTQPQVIAVNFSTIDVEPRKSTAWDAVLSWYNRPGGVISLGYFKKIVSVNQRQELCPVGGSVTAPLFDPITGQLTPRTFSPAYVNPNNNTDCRLDVLGTRIGDIGDPELNIFRTINVAEPVTVQGLEAQIQQNLDFLPGVLGNFGVILNATRVWTERVNGVEFFNVADFFGNAIGYYEDELLEGRLAYNYAGKTNLAEGGTFNGAGRTVRARGQIDFSGAIKPMPGLQVRFEVFNITNVVRQDYQDFEALNRRASYDGRTASVGVTYQF